MIRKITNTISLTLFALGSFAQPNVEFDSKTIDFGTIVEGSISKHRFAYKNTGNQPFIISNVSVTCGCTVPQWSKEALLPGDTASLYIQFDSRNKMGKVGKGVNLTTNCPDPMIGLIILATIVPDSNFKPIIDSISYKPITLVNLKSYFELKIPMKSLAKKGFKGNHADAEKIIKKLLIEKDLLLSQNAWITIDKEMIVINALDKNLQQSLIKLINTELLNKKRMKYWVKKAEG